MTPAEFTRPTGELDAAWFPAGDLETRLTTFIGRVAGEPVETAKAYVYWQAYESLVADLMSEPAQQRDRDKSDTFTDAQFDYWRGLAASWRARYESGRAVVRAAVGVAL